MTKGQLLAFSRRYRAALHKRLCRQMSESRLRPEHGLGNEALRLGLDPPELARIHKAAMAARAVPASSIARNRMVKCAGSFFAEIIQLIESAHGNETESAAQLNRQNVSLRRRMSGLAAANVQLKQGIIQRKTTEEALRKSEKACMKLLRDAQHLQRYLQRLTHQILSTQENDGREISRELDDEIAQTLLGIHVRLLTVKKAAAGRDDGLVREIATTHRLVENSVRIIDRFARKIRHPA